MTTVTTGNSKLNPSFIYSIPVPLISFLLFSFFLVQTKMTVLAIYSGVTITDPALWQTNSNEDDDDNDDDNNDDNDDNSWVLTDGKY